MPIVCPATRIVPLRALPEFDSTLNVIFPAPLPVAGSAIEIHGTSDSAAQTHPSDAVTLTVAVSPFPENEERLGDAAY